MQLDGSLVAGSATLTQGNRIVRERTIPRTSGVTAPPPCFGIKAGNPVIVQVKKEEDNSLKTEDKDIVTNLQLTGDNACSSGFYRHRDKDRFVV